MSRPKAYKSKQANSLNSVASPAEDAEHAIVRLPPNPRSRTKLDLSKELGHGVDAWVTAAAQACRKRIAGGNFATATLMFHMGGLTAFLRFLREVKVAPLPGSPAGMTAEIANRFIAWLRLGYPNGNAAKNHYAGFLSTVACLTEYGHMPRPVAALVPRNPFKTKHGKSNAETALSPDEMSKLAQTLKSDLSDIHHGRFKGIDADKATTMLVILAMRTGLNTTPMLEMTRDCLRPHPFMPAMMLIDTVKRRGSGAQSTAVAQTKLEESSAAIRMDAVAVLRMALTLSEPLRSEAPPHLSDRVWLYRPVGRPVNSLDSVKLGQRIAALVVRHKLVADDGAPLRLTLGRLRKTMESRLWRLTDGDILAVASAMGHKPNVADVHYLAVDADMKSEGALFLSDEFTAKLRGEELANTPTGRCQDTLHGALAPKDGSNHCDRFTKCLGCPSFALVGDADDLHRYFSFQKFLEADALSFSGEEWAEWREQREKLIASMDGLARNHFADEAVNLAKERAAAKPHPFWAIQMRRASERGADA